MAVGRTIQPKEIERCVGNIVSRLKMKLDEPVPTDGSCRVLLVEGKTDETFLENKICDDIKCFSMGGILKARDAFKTDNAKQANNCKEAILQTVYGLNVLPPVIDCKGADKWNVYGVVDRDYEGFESYTGSKRLYITDTHDLETLLMSTDKELLTRLSGCKISEEEINKSLFVAFQLATMREALIRFGNVTVRSIKSGSADVEFSSFVDGCKVSLKNLLAYANQENAKSDGTNVLTEKEQDKLIAKILGDKALKKKLTQDGFWKSDLEGFSPDNIDGFWTTVDGHDILALLRYFSEEAAIRFRNYSAFSLNRDFEMELINSYDNGQFKRTLLYASMLKDNVVRDF